MWKKLLGILVRAIIPKKWEFRVRWRGYEPEDDAMLDWSAVKVNLEALDECSKENPH